MFNEKVEGEKKKNDDTWTEFWAIKQKWHIGM